MGNYTSGTKGYQASATFLNHCQRGPYCPVEGPDTFKEGHRLETILCTPPYKVFYVTYTILLQPIFLIVFMAMAKNKVENSWFN